MARGWEKPQWFGFILWGMFIGAIVNSIFTTDVSTQGAASVLLVGAVCWLFPLIVHK